jgi:hypothetical protein
MLARITHAPRRYSLAADERAKHGALYLAGVPVTTHAGELAV